MSDSSPPLEAYQYPKWLSIVRVHWGAFYSFAQISSVATGMEGERRKKGLCQEYPEPGRVAGCLVRLSAVGAVAAKTGDETVDAVVHRI
jgi:hypothetical protein